MNKKEISEIRKLFTPESSVITRICGCYIDGEKEIKCKTKEAFHSLSEEEAFKYFEIFKHVCQVLWEKIFSIWNFLWNRKWRAEPRNFF